MPTYGQAFFGHSPPSVPAGPDWLWQGYLAPGLVTLLTAQWKTGKTTLLSLLLSRFGQGGPLAGLPVTPASAVVVSEESPQIWLPRIQRLNLRHVFFICQPFSQKPTLPEWLAFLDHLEHLLNDPNLFSTSIAPPPSPQATPSPQASLRACGVTSANTTNPTPQSETTPAPAPLSPSDRGRGAGGEGVPAPPRLLAFDTLASLLPAGSEDNSSSALNALLPLQRFTAAGRALLLTHHPRKGLPLAGQSARGSGALTGFGDILMEMHPWSRYLAAAPAAADRRRRLIAFSRSDQTPRQLLLQLNPDATDYSLLDPEEDDDFLLAWQTLRTILEDATRKLTRQGILADWPDDFPKPSPATLHRWLQRTHDHALIHCEGAGKKSDPFQYSLPYVAATWPQSDHVDQHLESIMAAFNQTREDAWNKLRPRRAATPPG